MTQPNLRELAKQGDTEAIAALLNHSLQPKGITVEVNITDSCLQILLSSQRLLNKQNLVAFLRNGLMKLEVKSISKVIVYGKQIDEDFPDWAEEFDLDEIQPPVEGINASASTILKLADDDDDLQEKGRQADIAAITTLLNRNLAGTDITVKANFQNGCLKIILESAQVPDQKKSIQLIRREVLNAKIEKIIKLTVYGKQIGEEFPSWNQDIQVNNQKISALLLAEERLKQTEFLIALRTFKFASVVPYKEAFSSELYSSNTVKLLLFFGLFPLAVSLLSRKLDLAQTAWILGIYYSSIWGVVLYNLIKPAQFSWGDTGKCAGFTAFVGIPLLLSVATVFPFSILYKATNAVSLLPRLVGFVLGVGVLEEVCKALPVYLFMLRSHKLKDPLTSAFYGAMSGLGFAISEGVGYSLKYANGFARSELSSESFGTYVLINTIRFVSLPLLHAIWAGIVGYFLGLAAINPSRKAPIIFIGVCISAVLHGLYDTFSDEFFGVAILTFSILLFVAYLRRSKHMVDEMQEAEINYKISKPS
jgi:RsiW-degrading membrane proteinase PrsW (M82 family)